MREPHRLDLAQRDIDIAVYASIVAGTLALVLSLLTLMAHTASNLELSIAALDIATSFGLAFGIARRSRAAAVGAMLLLVLYSAFRLSQAGFPSGLFGALIFGYCYFCGIRGTCAYRAHARVSQPSESNAPAV